MAVSSAVLYGLPVWRLGLDRVHVTRPRRNGGRARRAVHVLATPLRPDEIGTVAGVPVTCPARIVVDLARTAPFAAAVAGADAALHLELVTSDELAAAVLRAGRWPGVPAARRVLEFVDGRSESVGESRSRVAIQRAGLPQDIAAAALWLASDDSSFVNGHALVVDGGLTGGVLWSMQPPLMKEHQPLAERMQRRR